MKILKLIKKGFQIGEIYQNHMGYVDLYLKVIDQKNITSTDNKKYGLKKFKIPFFDLDYYEWEQKAIGYLEQTNEKFL